MSNRAVAVVSAAAVAALVASCGGALIVLADYFLFKSTAVILETLSILPRGWAMGHLVWLMEAAAVLAIPIVAVLAVYAFRTALRAERTLFRIPTDVTDPDA